MTTQPPATIVQSQPAQPFYYMVGPQPGQPFQMMPSHTGTFVPSPSVITQMAPAQNPQQGAKRGRNANRRRGQRGRGGGNQNASGLQTTMARSGTVNVMPATMYTTAPTQHLRASTSNGVRMRGRELYRKYTNPNTGGEFNAIYLGLNPNQMPWLAPIARNYEQFFFHSITFTWQPAFASANGTIGLAIDTDFNDDPPKDMGTLLKNCYSVAGIVSSPMSFKFNGKEGSLSGRYLISSKNTTTVLTQQGQFLIGAEAVGEQTAFGVKKDSVLGYVFADYDIELFVPQGSTEA